MCTQIVSNALVGPASSSPLVDHMCACALLSLTAADKLMSAVLFKLTALNGRAPPHDMLILFQSRAKQVNVK